MENKIIIVSAQTDAEYNMEENQIQAAYDYQQWQNCYKNAQNHIKSWKL